MVCFSGVIDSFQKSFGKDLHVAVQKEADTAHAKSKVAAKTLVKAPRPTQPGPELKRIVK